MSGVFSAQADDSDVEFGGELKFNGQPEAPAKVEELLFAGHPVGPDGGRKEKGPRVRFEVSFDEGVGFIEHGDAADKGRGVVVFGVDRDAVDGSVDEEPLALEFEVVDVERFGMGDVEEGVVGYFDVVAVEVGDA